MHSCQSKHGIHKISSLSGTYGNNLHIRLTLDFLVIFPNARHAVWYRDGGKATAIFKNSVSYACYTVWYRDGGKPTATLESMISYACHAIGNHYGGKAVAILKSAFSYARHAIGNHYGGKAVAILKCIASNRGYARFYHHLFNIRTVIEWCKTTTVIKHVSTSENGERLFGFRVHPCDIVAACAAFVCTS